MALEVKLVIQGQEVKMEKGVKPVPEDLMVQLEYRVPQENKVRRVIQENKVRLA
jgi:hypothetical protein